MCIPYDIRALSLPIYYKAITRQGIVLLRWGRGMKKILQDMDLKNPFFGRVQTMTTA